MIAKQAVADKIKEFLTKIEEDLPGSPWLFAEFETFIKELHELKDIARVDLAKFHAPKPGWHGALDAVTEFVHEAEQKVEAVFEEIKADVSPKAKKAAKVEEPVVEAPAAEAPAPAPDAGNNTNQ